MAVLNAMPDVAVISGLKGKVDFYEWMGIPVARRWPRWTLTQRSPAVVAQQPAWAYASRLWGQLSPEVQAAYRVMAQSSGLSCRDIQIRSFLSGVFTYPH